jgi:U1 small nuclear ribonucleoprotein
MKAAYKDADGLKIMGRRIVVDVERGRTVKGWKPKRLGKNGLMRHMLSFIN